MNGGFNINKHLIYLTEAISMAKEALKTNNSPFGSILVLDMKLFLKIIIELVRVIILIIQNLRLLNMPL